MSLVWDPWDPGYTRAAEDDGPGTESNATVDPDVERPVASWQALPAPAGLRPPDVVLFVDGVLRNDARGWFIEPDGTSHPTLAASYAAGVVRTDARRGVAEVVPRPQVQRALLSPATGARAIGAAPARYTAHRVPGGTKQLDAALRTLMRALEVAVTRAARDGTGDDLIVADGRLHRHRELPRALGCVKTQTGRYLPPALTSVVTSLPPGHRTPVFRLSSLYSWYLRLPGPAGGPWSGIVRVECSGDLPVAGAVELADLSAVTLPRFASNPYKDPRAPQNLVPVAGLERRLRGLLGDPRLLHRLVRAASTADAAADTAGVAAGAPGTG